MRSPLTALFGAPLPRRRSTCQSVESLCIHQKAALLYENLVAQCERHISGLLVSLADAARSADAGSEHSAAGGGSSVSLPFLHRVHAVWTAHCDEMLIIRGIFLYLDRTFVIQQATLAQQTQPRTNAMDDGSAASALPAPKSLWDMGLGIFGQQLQSESHTSCMRLVCV
jgi:hypothetical protein